MAIRKEKYIDIASKLGGQSVATRRSLTGRVFTTAPSISTRGIKTFYSADEVMDFFGKSSKEYKFAVKYFGFVSKTATTAEQISFCGWGSKAESENKDFRKFKMIVNSASSVSVTSEFDGSVKTYSSMNAALEGIGEYAIIDITLDTDICYIREADCLAGDSDTFNIGDKIYKSLINVTGMDELNKTSDWKLLNGLVINANQTVSFDLNGHIFGGYNHCFINYGTLSIYDSVGFGRAFTTNLSKWIRTESGKMRPHSSRYEEMVSRTYTSSAISTGKYDSVNGSNITRDTCEVVRNHGECTINGGWFGIAKCTTSPWLNETTWGNAIATYDDSMLTINAGYFTCVPHNNQGARLAQLSGIADSDRVLGYLDGSSEKTIVTQGLYYAYCGIVDCYASSRVLVNGGTFFGLFNDIFEVKGDGTSSTPDYGGVVIKGGSFYGGFTDETYVPTANYNRQSFLQASAPTKNVTPIITDANTIPTQGYNRSTSATVALTGSSAIVVDGGYFYDNVDVENTTLTQPPKKDNSLYSSSFFTGLVSIHNMDANFSFAAEFKTLTLDLSTHFATEKPVEALARIDELDDNFGSFCFMEALTPDEAREVAEWNAAKNFKYLYSLPVKVSNCKQILETVRDMSGTCYTLDKFDAFAEFMPMALFAATKYDRVNATKVFMYQQFDGERASVTTSQDADKYDAFDIDGQGTRFPVNYYGATQQAGSLINFYQDGYNADGLDTACYCNEIWLKDAISVELLNTFIALEKIPANNVGEAICRNAQLAEGVCGQDCGSCERMGECGIVWVLADG